MWTRSMLRTLSVLFVGWTLAATAISCNTMEGAGQDIEKAGDNIKDAARDAKD